MTDLNTAPVELPAGSFDYDKLKKGLDTAAKAKPEKYADAISAAFEGAGDVVIQIDPRDAPGHKFVDIENKDLGVTESVQVYDPKQADDAEQAQQEAIPATPTTPAETAEGTTPTSDEPKE